MKKRILSTLLALVMTCSLVTPALAARRTLHLNAHRGYSAAAPENTVAAVKEAGKRGFYGCEFDIQTTKDKVWVAIHNSTISGVTNGSGLVSGMTYEQLQQYPITKGNGVDRYPDERIPTLTQMLDECKRWNLHPIIEIKGNDSAAIPALCALLDSRQEKDKFTVISFNQSLLCQVKELLPDMECAYLTTVLSFADVSYCKQYHIEGISFNGTVVDQTMIQAVANQGLTLTAWTIDKTEKAQALYEAGVDYITTNKLTPADEKTITGKGEGILHRLQTVFLRVRNSAQDTVEKLLGKWFPVK